MQSTLPQEIILPLMIWSADNACLIKKTAILGQSSRISRTSDNLFATFMHALKSSSPNANIGIEEEEEE